MDFVQTRIGMEICSVGRAALGKYLKKRVQFAVSSHICDAENLLNDHLKDGKRFVDLKVGVPSKEWCLIVLEMDD